MMQSRLSASWLHSVFHIYAVVVWLNILYTKSTLAQDGATLTDEQEKQAFYDVMGALNHDWDWRTMLPDPCGVNAIKGINCDLEGDTLYFTDLNFGPTYDNTPACSSNATIHPSIVKFKRLRTLSFYNCFTQENRTIPAMLGSLGSTLLSLTFRFNSALVGSIPSELGTLNGLERLVLTQNKLQGSVPMELGNLSNLKQLVVNHNNIGGAIPSQIGSLQNLIVLDLSHNLLSGVIPVELGTLSSLQMLDVSYNSLNGAIPDEIGKLGALTLLDLSNNMLRGSLPHSMENLQQLQQLFLNHNQLGGRLPDFWSGMRNLVSVDLSDSGYEGFIPESIGQATKLKYLGLSGNRLTGSIPSQLGFLQISEMNLSQNCLSGPIPFSATFMKRLGSNLKLSNNSGLCYNPANFNFTVDLNTCPPTSWMAGSVQEIPSTSSPTVAPNSNRAEKVYLDWLPVTFCGCLSVIIISQRLFFVD